MSLFPEEITVALGTVKTRPPGPNAEEPLFARTGPRHEDNAGDLMWSIWLGEAEHPFACTHIPQCPVREMREAAAKWAAKFA